MATSQTLPPRLSLRDDGRRVGGDESELLRRLDDLWDEGARIRDSHAPPRDIENDLALFRGESGPERKHFAANFVEAFIDRMVAQLTDNRPIVRIDSRKAGLHGVARIVDKAARVAWDDAAMQRQAYKMAHLAATMRSSGLYTGYDPLTDDIILDPIRQDQIVFDPRVREAARIGRAANYLLIRRIIPTAELAVRFPGRGGAVSPDSHLSSLRPRRDSEGRKSILSPVRSLFSLAGGDDREVIPSAEITECWVRDWQRAADGSLMFPNGRMVVRSRDLALWDGPNPFWDGDWPIDWFDWMVDPDHPWGRGEPARLRHLQMSFNRLLDGLVRNQIISNVFTIIADWDAFAPEFWQKLQKIDDTLVLRKQNRNSVVTPVPPPTFGADKLNIARQIFTFAQMLTGVTDVTLGETPGSLQSGVAIEGLQEGANLMNRSRASRLEDLYERVGQKLIARIFQFYDSDRVLAMAGTSPDAVDYAKKRQELFFEMNDGKVVTTTPEARRAVFRDLRFSVSPGSSAPGTRASRTRSMAELYTLGLASGEDVLAAGDFPEPAEMLKRAQAERAKLAAAGVEPPTLPGQNRGGR